MNHAAVQPSQEPSEPSPDDILRSDQIATMLGVSRSTVYTLKDEEGLPYIQIGKKRIGFRRGDVLDWVAKRTSVVEKAPEGEQAS